MSTTTRPIFDPVDTSFDPTAHSRKDDVESPSLSSSNALARFEFEPGRTSRDGTKVLMLEWTDDSSGTRGDEEGKEEEEEESWEVSWEGKKTLVPAASTPDAVNRLYFMLGPGVNVPTSVQLRKGSTHWRTNPLPAIFAPELGATAREAGKKGVLHTIWAKKRLQVLQGEIDAEGKENAEGIGLEMAVAEKEWIEQNFGVLARPSAAVASAEGPPLSPRSPGGGRLMEKMKGMKLGTTAADLKGAGGGQEDEHNPLSPESSDVAMGSFGSFAAMKGLPESSTLASKPPQRMTAVRPPEGRNAQSGMGSLNAFASADTGFASVRPDDDNDGDDLFALPMSPRSPEMAKSPFSFAAQDTRKYVK